MSLPNSDLLKPRWLVCASYPGSNLPVDHIIERNFSMGLLQRENLDKYPNIFTELRWWQRRETKDMPEYVKSTLWVAKVKEWINNNESFIDINYNEESETRAYIPATKEEYDIYINSKTNK